MKTLGLSVGCSAILLVLLLIVGWFNNVNYVVDSNFDDVSGREIVSVIGVVAAPIGAFNGVIYIFEDEKNEVEVNEEYKNH